MTDTEKKIKKLKSSLSNINTKEANYLRGRLDEQANNYFLIEDNLNALSTDIEKYVSTSCRRKRKVEGRGYDLVKIVNDMFSENPEGILDTRDILKYIRKKGISRRINDNNETQAIRSRFYKLPDTINRKKIDLEGNIKKWLVYQDSYFQEIDKQLVRKRFIHKLIQSPELGMPVYDYELLSATGLVFKNMQKVDEFFCKLADYSKENLGVKLERKDGLIYSSKEEKYDYKNTALKKAKEEEVRAMSSIKLELIERNLQNIFKNTKDEDTFNLIEKIQLQRGLESSVMHLEYKWTILKENDDDFIDDKVHLLKPIYEVLKKKGSAFDWEIAYILDAPIYTVQHGLKTLGGGELSCPHVQQGFKHITVNGKRVGVETVK